MSVNPDAVKTLAQLLDEDKAMLIVRELHRQNNAAERREKREKFGNVVLGVVGVCALAITGLVFYDRFS